MMLLSAFRLSCLLSSVAVLGLRPSSAAACDDAPVPRWTPERSSPSACEPDVPLEGFVLLEGDARGPGDPTGGGELEIVVQRVRAGTVLETFPGEISQPDGTSALFRSLRPLAPNAEYLVVARRLSPAGEQLGPRFTSAFSTGVRTLAPLGFRHEPSVRLETAEREVQACAADACGSERCAPTGELEETKLLRISVPPIDGGLEQRPYFVSAQLVTSSSAGQAAVVATSDTAATQAGKRSFAVIELPHLAGPELAIEGCVTVTATDVAGHTATTLPTCLPLPTSAGETAPSAAPEQTEVEPPEHDEAEPQHGEGDDDAVEQGEQAELEELEYSEASDPITDGDAEGANADAAGGCAIAPTGGHGNGLTWIALSLTVALLRARPRRSHRRS